MRNQVGIPSESDEIEAFLRIIIRQRWWFFATMIFVLAVGLGWALLPAPKYAMSFSYLVGPKPDHPNEMLISGELLRETVQIASLEFARTSQSISGAEHAFRRDPDYTLSIVDPVLRFSMATTEGRSELVASFEQAIIDDLDRTLANRRATMLDATAFAREGVDLEIAGLDKAMLRSPGNESLSLRLASAIARKAELESRQLLLENTAPGRLLDGPTRSRDIVGMSRVFKIFLVCFLALMVSVFAAIFAEYTKRAIRPI